MMFYLTRKYHEIKLNREQKKVAKLFKENSNQVNDEIFERQVAINMKRNELDLVDKTEIIDDEGFVQ